MAGSTPVEKVPHFPEPVAPCAVPAAIVAAESTPVPWWAFWRQPIHTPFKPRITEIWQHVAFDQHVLGKKPHADGPPTNTGAPSSSPWHFPGSIFHHFPAGHKQSTFWSYSFRNNEGMARPWGANDAEEKEDNSESDEEEDTHQNKCLTVIRQFGRAVFPHFYPLIWLMLPFVVCAGLFVAAYGDFGETGDEKLLVFVRDASSALRASTDIEDLVVKQLSRRELMQQGLVVLVFISLMNALAWICCMVIRAILLTFIVNAGLYEQQTVSSLLTTIDPELFYFIWSVAVFLFWQQNLTKGRFYAVPAVDTSQAHQQLYWSPCFGSSMFVNDSFADILRSICQVTVLLATRRLVQSIMVFCFELGFMANMSSQLGKYLTKYAALRKLNTRWAAYQMYKESTSQCSDEMSQDEDERMRLDQCFDELRRGRSITSAASRVSRYSRYSRHPSLRVPLRAMPSLVKEEQEQSPPRLPNQYQASRSSKAPKDIGIRFVARAVRANYFRFRFQVNQNIQARELRGQGIPSQLTRSSIERIKQSKIHHWVLLQYVAVFPPAIFLHGRRIELDSKATARSVATSLFAALAADAAELAHDSQPKEPAYQKARGGAFGDGLQQNKQGHAPEHERTVTWLGSPDLQKTVPLDPVEEGIPTSATAAGPSTTEPCVSGSLGDNATLAPPNNSTNSTEPAADAGARADSPSGASDLLPPAAMPVAEETASRTPASEADGAGDKEPGRSLGVKFPFTNESAKETGQRGIAMLGPPAAAVGNVLLEKPLLQQPASSPKPPTKDALPSAASETQQPRRFEDKGNGEGSGEESEPLEYLEGSFEFSVGQPNGDGQARTTRRGRTQHISTLTPFNIAIRSPSVDVDAEDVEAREASFTADQQQGTAWPADSFAIDVQADKDACVSPREKKHRRRNWAAPRARSAGGRPAATTASQKQEVELAGVSRNQGGSCYPAAIDEEEGFCSSHSENECFPDGGSFAASSSLENMSIASSGFTALRGGPEQDEEQERPQRVARGAAVLGAININSSLFNDGDFGTMPFPKGGSSSPEPGVGGCASPSNETGGGRRLLDPNNAGEEEYSRRSRYGPAQPAPEYFTRAFVEMFLRGDEVDEFMKQVDLAGHGKINQSMLKRAVISIYKMRKALLKSLTSQASICKTVRRMISIVLWAATLVAMLLVFGVNLNTVIVSGAAAISALTVALSYIYQNFITAVIYVAFTNPYNVGDRIRVDGGEAMYVRNIHTYTTEFVTVHGKPVVYSNTVLFGRQLMNESRSTNATFSMPMRLDIRTQLQSLRFLEAGMRKAIATRPMDFVKDSFSIYITDVQPGRYMDRLCIRLGISYQEPLLPVHLSSPQPPPSNGQSVPLGPGHFFQPSAAHGAANGTSSISLATLPELEGGQCYRGSPPAPSGVPLNSLYCEPSALQPFSTSPQSRTQQEALHAQWLPPSASSLRREEKYHVEEERRGLQRGGVWDSPKSRRGGAPSHSSAASRGRLCSSDRSSVSSWEAEHNEDCEACRRGSCEHAPLRRSAPLSNADCHEMQSASPLRTAHSSEFVRAGCGGARPRRRHRNTAVVGGYQ
ncbi:hypothetical protein Emag_004493 [Eimeria magna]